MSNIQNPTIAILDSGIGGVSILRQLLSRFHTGNYIYFADNLYMPYGNKNHHSIKKRVELLIDLLIKKYKADIVIIACNTASTCIDDKKYKKIYIMSFDKKYIYYATGLTKNNLKDYQVIADRSLAKMIESNIFDEKKLKTIVARHIDSHGLRKYRKIVLGCTHYELISDTFKSLCPDVEFVSNSSFVIEKINYQPSADLNIKILLSKYSKSYHDKINKLIRRDICAEYLDT
ncbi:MAG: hypothetical protein E7351_02230 [Clostridiales bacterium]|nr:hypothetical protein [Clostridiales bacterium]